MVFSWLNWHCTFLGGKPQREWAIHITANQGHSRSMGLAGADADLDQLAKVVLVRFLQGKDTQLLLPLYYNFSKRVTVHSLHLQTGELCPIFLRAEYLYELFGIFPHRFSSSCLSDYLFISIWPQGYLSYTLVVIWYYFIDLFPQIVQLWPLGTYADDPIIQLPYPQHSVFTLFLLWALSYSLAPKDAPGSLHIFPVPV